MQIVNLTEKDVLNGLKSPKIYGEYWGDYYRKFTEYDKDNILGLYYKDLWKVDTPSKLRSSIEIAKSCHNHEYTWEHYTMNRIFTIVNRLEDVYSKIYKTTDLKSPIITGIALYKNYPVGTIFPRELLNYKKYHDILDSHPEISPDDKAKILAKAEYLLKLLIKNNVYPTNIFSGNIMVNPNNYSDVRIDGLDAPLIARVETNMYATKLKNNGRDLVEDTWNNYTKIKRL